MTPAHMSVVAAPGKSLKAAGVATEGRLPQLGDWSTSPQRIHGLGRFNWLVGLDLGHLLCNAALGFQRVIGVLEPQEIAFGQAKKLA